MLFPVKFVIYKNAQIFDTVFFLNRDVINFDINGRIGFFLIRYRKEVGLINIKRYSLLAESHAETFLSHDLLWTICLLHCYVNRRC